MAHNAKLVPPATPPIQPAILLHAPSNWTASSVSGTRVSGCSCACQKGYAGQRCDACESFYGGYPNCASTACTVNNSCSGHASGVNGTMPNCSCACLKGYRGSTCSECSALYVGYPNCTLGSCFVDEHCNSHAGTVSGAPPSCNCTCREGYFGARCDKCASGYTNYPTCQRDCTPERLCSGHANEVLSCSVCRCTTGYGGTTCNSCSAGYGVYPHCEALPCSVPVDCSGHASRVLGKVPTGCTCICLSGFTGSKCNLFSPGYQSYPACSPSPCSLYSHCNGHASSVSGTVVSGCA